MGFLLEHFVPALGVLVANALFLSPLKPVLAAKRQNALGPLNPLVYCAMHANCVGWLVYAFLKRDPYILASNFGGALLAQFMVLSCVGAADASSPHERQARDAAIRSALFFGGVLSAAGAAISFSNLPLEQAARAWGFVTVAILLVFYASPLSVLARVLRSRNSASLQLPFAAMNAVNGLLWAAYGFAVNDAFVWAPNAAGAVFGVLQVALCLVYPPTPLGGGSGGDLAGAAAAALAEDGSGGGAGLLQPRPPSSGTVGSDAEKGRGVVGAF
jgi:solute carrier family 50 protein (sugar transporter)